jgi:hypothetical protein
MPQVIRKHPTMTTTITSHLEEVIHKCDDKPHHPEAFTIRDRNRQVIQSSSTTEG